MGIDLGRRRIGLAISDASGTLARPLRVLDGLSGAARVEAIRQELAAWDDEGAVTTVVIGLPRRLDGTPTDMTAPAEAFAQDIRSRTGLAVVFQDERLTSREAEARLAVRERDWRVRKARLDAAAAAIILQDYLDGRGCGPSIEPEDTES